MALVSNVDELQRRAAVAAARAAFPIPTDPDVLMNRRDTAAALSAAGFQVSSATLATKATRGGGPVFRLWGKKPLYRWGDSFEWAQSRLKPPIGSTAEDDVPPAMRAPNGKLPARADGISRSAR
jgi:hypothetical protein